VAQLGLGRADDALASVRRSQEHYPDVDYTLWAEGLALYHLGKARDVPRVFEGLTDRWSEAWPVVARALSGIQEGNEAAARECLARLQAAGANCKAGVVHAALGEMDAAFEAFAATGEPFWDDELFLRYHRATPMEAVRADARYSEVIGRLDRAWGLRSA
jgi:hypothetical protein